MSAATRRRVFDIIRLGRLELPELGGVPSDVAQRIATISAGARVPLPAGTSTPSSARGFGIDISGAAARPALAPPGPYASPSRACSAAAFTSGSAEPAPSPSAPPPTDVASRLLVDTLLMMKKYEEAGLSRGQAEALTRQITDVILAVCAHNSASFVSKDALDRLLVELKAHQKSQGQELVVQQQVYLAGMSKDTERLQAQLDKFRADIKHDVDKLTANQKLDLNLERGRLRDELQQVRDQIVQINTECMREVNLVRTQVESSKSDTLKWVVVTVGGLLGVGLAAIRLSLAA